MRLASLLKEYAAEIGIDHLGISRAANLEAIAPFLEERRQELPPFLPPRWGQSPTQLLPDARSVVAIAIPYLRSAPAPPDNLHGVLARYAWIEDYHLLLQEKLGQLANFLRKERGGNFIISADTGPIIDRFAAYSAGLGWYGLNHSLFVPGRGSWIVLGEILTDIELEPDPPLNSRCLECRRCLKACPTGALTLSGLDYGRCISYLTQMKGMVPRELRPWMGRALGGCDRCQEVCPHNQGVPTVEGEILPGAPYPVLAEVLAMDKKEWTAGLGRSAVGWRGLTIFQRNAVIALGNSKDPEAIAPLADALHNPRPGVRAHAVWALGQMPYPAARRLLSSLHPQDPLTAEELAALRA